jgi:hypothetical protein
MAEDYAPSAVFVLRRLRPDNNRVTRQARYLNVKPRLHGGGQSPRTLRKTKKYTDRKMARIGTGSDPRSTEPQGGPAAPEPPGSRQGAPFR